MSGDVQNVCAITIVGTVLNTGKTVEISHFVIELARCYDAVKIPYCLTVRHSTEMVH